MLEKIIEMEQEFKLEEQQAILTIQNMYTNIFEGLNNLKKEVAKMYENYKKPVEDVPFEADLDDYLTDQEIAEMKAARKAADRIEEEKEIVSPFDERQFDYYNEIALEEEKAPF